MEGTFCVTISECILTISKRSWESDHRTDVALNMWPLKIIKYIKIKCEQKGDAAGSNHVSLQALRFCQLSIQIHSMEIFNIFIFFRFGNNSMRCFLTHAACVIAGSCI